MNFWGKFKIAFSIRKNKIKEYKRQIRKYSEIVDEKIKEKKTYISELNELRRLKTGLKALKLNRNLSRHFKFNPSIGGRNRYPHRIPSNNKIIRDKYLKINQG